MVWDREKKGHLIDIFIYTAKYAGQKCSKVFRNDDIFEIGNERYFHRKRSLSGDGVRWLPIRLCIVPKTFPRINPA